MAGSGGVAETDNDRVTMSYRKAIRTSMTVLSGDWVVAVLASLAARPHQYKDLLIAINNAEEGQQLSSKVLSATLRRMRRDGIVARSYSSESFRPVWYELTPVGRQLLQALRPLAKWALDNGEAVTTSRSEFTKSDRK